MIARCTQRPPRPIPQFTLRKRNAREKENRYIAVVPALASHSRYVLVGEASGNMKEKSRLASETIRVRLHLRVVRRTVSEINQFTERRERERGKEQEG